MLKRRVLFLICCVLLGAFACTPSVNPALKASVDKKLQTKSARSFEQPSAAEQMPLAVGQWTTYKMTDKEGKPSLMQYKVVGEEDGAFWLETVNESYYQRQVTLMLLDVGDRKDPSKMEVRAMRQKSNDAEATEVPPELLRVMAGVWKPLVASMVQDWQDKPQEDAQVAAGSFARCYKVDATVTLLGRTQRSLSWSHPAVPMSGGVKSEATDGSFKMELLEFGTEGATSELGL